MFNLGKKGNYAYTIARVKAKKSQLMGDDAYQKMMQMSLVEISRFISEAGYSKEIAEYTGKFDGINLIEHATYKNMARLFKGILDSTNGELHEILAATLNKWDIWNVEIILRGKSAGVNIDAIKEDLVAAGTLSDEDLEKLIGIETVEDTLTSYSKMTGTLIPQEVYAEYKAKANLQPIEDYLSKNYYERLLESLDPKSKPMRLYQDYIRKQIDMINLETILKLKLEGIHGEEVMKYIIPGGKDIDRKLAAQLANAETIAAAEGDLAQLSFYDDIKDAIGANTTSLRDVVSCMNRCAAETTKTFSHLYPLSIIPIVDYMLHKENEVNNIRIIARGLNCGLDKETINGLLVI